MTISKVAGSAFCARSFIAALAPSLIPARQQHETILVHLGLPAGRNEDRGFERFDHDRTRAPPAPPASACDHRSWRRLRRLRGTRAGVCDLTASVPERRRRVADQERRDRADRCETNADDLDRLAAIVMAVCLQVTIVEGLGDLVERRRVDRARWNRYQQLIGLPRIARIDRTLEPPPLGRDAGTVEHRGALALERDEGGLQGRGIDGVGRHCTTSARSRASNPCRSDRVPKTLPGSAGRSPRRCRARRRARRHAAVPPRRRRRARNRADRGRVARIRS